MNDINYVVNSLMKMCKLFLLGLLFSVNIHAQVDPAIKQVNKGMHLLDHTSGNVVKGNLEFSILDLTTSDKGFLMPRLTTAERSNIPKESLVGGLMIYNTTIDCVEFYNSTRQRWLSTCGTNDPAVFEISNKACSSTIPQGKYAQGVLVDGRVNIIFLEVNVSQAGPFVIDAIAFNGNNNNGYNFRAKGSFPTPGVYTVALKGSGVPKVGYGKDNNGNALGKDIIKFYLNEVVSTCIASNFVDKDFIPLDASFVCNDTNNKIIAEGTYKLDEALTSENIIKVPIKVSKAGRGKIYGEIPVAGSQLKAIQYESVLTDFEVTNGNSVQWVTLRPLPNTGKPGNSGDIKVNLKLVSNGKYDYDPFEPKSISEVTGCSDFTIYVKPSIAKYSFTGDFELKSTKKFESLGSPVGKMYITPYTPMRDGKNSNFKLIATIDVEKAGDFKIQTDEQNEMYFYREGTIPISDIGKKITIELLPYGKSGPTSPLLGGFSFTAYDLYEGNVGSSNNKSAASSIIEFVHSPMYIYGLGHQAWYPGGQYGSEGGTYNGITNFMKQFVPLHFHYSGTVRVDGVYLLTSYGTTTSGDMSGNLSTFNDRMSQADIVFLGAYSASHSFSKDSDALETLASYAKTGVSVIYAESGSTTYRKQITTFASHFGGIAILSSNDANTGAVATIKDSSGKNHSESIVKGVFGDLSGLSVAGGYSNSTSTFFTTIGGGFNSLAEYDGYPSHGTFAAIHDKYGVVVVSSATFMGGYSSAQTGSKNNYPMRVDSSGNLLTAPYDKNVYNSTFLANLLHWGIISAQEKKGQIIN